MSEERAIKFCRKCYSYAVNVSFISEPPVIEVNRDFTYRDFLFLLRDHATSQAMQGLEEEIVYTSTETPEFLKALKLCQECDYKAPRIAQLLQGQTEKPTS